MTALFFIPGTALPEKKIELPLDKLIHIGFFSILVFLWKSAFFSDRKYYNHVIFMTACVYGFIVEILQGLLVAQRSFDIYDLYADAIGSVLGLVIWTMVYKKK